MREFRVRSNNHGADYVISGEDLPDAIVNNFDRIHQDAKFGNAAGYKLVSVTAAYKPEILGGKGGCELIVEHTGLDLAHEPADPTPQKAVVWIYCEPEDLPESVELL